MSVKLSLPLPLMCISNANLVMPELHNCVLVLVANISFSATCVQALLFDTLGSACLLPFQGSQRL